MQKALLFTCISLSLFCKGFAQDIKIVPRPITFDAQRKKLTLHYMKERYGMHQNSVSIEPKMIVIHWTAVDDVNKCFNIFAPATLASSRKELSASALNVSAHFLVDRDGTIFQLMPESWMARHVIGLNHCAIGIENVGGVNGTEDLTQKQLEANIYLVQKLKRKYPKINYLIGHYEYLQFERHGLWKEKPTSLRTKKQDPGPKFMQALRERVVNLGLASSPISGY
jgi:N-acetyl-anhydromuramyl-L-alanine amidase AmpD